MPPDPLRKNKLFSEARTNGHQFFFTTGWKERFAQQNVFGILFLFLKTFLGSGEFGKVKKKNFFNSAKFENSQKSEQK